MRWANRIFLAGINLQKRGYFQKNIIVLVIAGILLICCGSVAKSIDKHFNNYLIGAPSMRTIRVVGIKEDASLIYEKLTQIKSPHITDAFRTPTGMRMTVINTEEVKGFEENKKSSAFGEIITCADRYYDSRYLVDGRWIIPGENNVAVIPKHFSMTAVDDGQAWNTKLEYVDGKELIGRTFYTKYYTYREVNFSLIPDKEFSYFFEVIGTYDNVMASTASCEIITSYDDVVNIDTIFASNSNTTPSEGVDFRVMVDQQINVDEVMADIKENFKGNPALLDIFREGRPGTLSEAAIFLSVFSKGMALCLGVFCFFTTSVIYYRSIKKRTKEIGIYKAIGYTNKDVFVNLTIETAFMSVIAFLLSLLVSGIILLAVYVAVQLNASIFVKAIKLGVSGTEILLSAGLCIAVPFIGSVFGMVKALKVNPKEALYTKEKELM